MEVDTFWKFIKIPSQTILEKVQWLGGRMYLIKQTGYEIQSSIGNLELEAGFLPSFLYCLCTIMYKAFFSFFFCICWEGIQLLFGSHSEKFNLVIRE
jgi:hypothetical protein